jgi:hypothetical protein
VAKKKAIRRPTEEAALAHVMREQQLALQAEDGKEEDERALAGEVKKGEGSLPLPPSQ